MLPARIPKDHTGRRLEPVKREGMSPRHLELVRALPCVVYGTVPSDPHHLLRVVDDKGFRIVKSASQTQADKWAIPLSRKAHDELHAHGDEEAYLALRGIDGRALARALWAASPDHEAMIRIVYRARQPGR